MNTKSIKIFRFSVRSLGIILILFALIMFTGEAFFSKESISENPMSANSILQLSMMGIILIGLLIAWKREIAGGVIALAAYIALAIVNPRTVGFSLLLVFPVTAILFIVLGIMSRKTTVKRD